MSIDWRISCSKPLSFRFLIRICWRCWFRGIQDCVYCDEPICSNLLLLISISFKVFTFNDQDILAGKGTSVCLRAIRGRCVDGFDLPLFKKLLPLRRQFIQEFSLVLQWQFMASNFHQHQDGWNFNFNKRFMTRF